jgi:hypothetical protein
MTFAALTRISLAYRRWALALLGALLLIGISQIATVETGAAGVPGDDLELTLGGMPIIKQTFTTTRPGLVGLSVRLKPGRPGDAAPAIPIWLRYADGLPVDLVSASLDPARAEGGIVTVRFPPLRASRDPYLITGTLQLVLEIPAIPPSTGPLITVYRRSPTQGDLRIDGRAQPGLDLAVVPIYQSSWIDSLWPISAMAAGKPGLLGQPALYILLVYLYLLLIGAGIAALLRAYRADPEGDRSG